MALSKETYPDLEVTVHVLVLNDAEPIRQRHVVLSNPEWSFPIGRGSATESNLSPHEENCWFTSRVMSRNHAILRADPDTRRLLIEDVGSMHGTQLDGATLAKNIGESVDQGSELTFGTQVVRGPESYNPLRIRIAFEWSDDISEVEFISAQAVIKPSIVADFSDDDLQSDGSDDCHVVMESVQQPDKQLLVGHSKAFRVPDDDSSSIHSIDEGSIPDQLTSQSDPTELSEEEEKKSGHFDAINTELDSLNDSRDPVNNVHNIAQDEEMWSDEDGELPCKGIQSSIPATKPDQTVQVSGDHGCGHAGSSVASPSYTPVVPSIPSPTHMPTSLSYLLRDPSPSDAALAKPSAKLAHPTSIHEEARSAATNVAKETCDSFHAAETENHYPSFDQSRANWSPPFPSYDPGSSSYNSCFSPSVVEPSWAIPAGLPSLAEYMSGPVDITQPSITKSVPAVNHAKRTEHTNEQNKLKRKANRMADLDGDMASAESIIWLNGSKASPLTDLPDPAAPSPGAVAVNHTTDRAISTATGAVLEDTSHATKKSLVVVNKAVEEPPRKKAKIRAEQLLQRQRKTGSSLTRYAASALIGAAFGAVGTVVGLASLPKDFFH